MRADKPPASVAEFSKLTIWLAQLGEQRMPLSVMRGKPPQLTVEGAIWCFYLLESRVPTSSKAAQLREQEPQLDWVMLRAKACRNPRIRLESAPKTMPK